jgi:hypothetical protein
MKNAAEMTPKRAPAGRLKSVIGCVISIAARSKLGVERTDLPWLYSLKSIQSATIKTRGHFTTKCSGNKAKIELP